MNFINKPKLAFIVAPYYQEITKGLVRGATELLKNHEIEISPEAIFEAPGALEIPLVAKIAAKTKKFDGIICLGCVIQGETAHFKLILSALSVGLTQVSLETEIPITSGVLMVFNEAQALKRSKFDFPQQKKNLQVLSHSNRGTEAAWACLKTIESLRKIQVF